MRSKRKASSVFTRSSRHKRRENWNHQYIVTSSDEEKSTADDIEEEIGDNEEWEINGILEETESQYLLDWVGPWSPTWEPKENASEVAVQIWEEAKKKEQLGSGRRGASVESDPTQSHDSVTERFETPDRQVVLQPSLSPLFVPLESVSETHSQEISETPQYSLATQTSSQPCTDINPSQQKQHQGVFEYYPRAPIPPEYRLPGEFEKSPSQITQYNGSTDVASTRGISSLSVTEGISRVSEASQLGQAAVVQHSLRSEIPETPSIPLNFPPSQASWAGSRLGTVGSQPSANSQSHLSLNPSAWTSQSNSHPSAGSLRSARAILGPSSQAVYNRLRDTTSVPETVLTNRHLTLAIAAPRSFADSSSSNLLLPTPSATRSQIPSGPAITKSTTQHNRTTQATMDDQSQKKEGGALARTMEKYSHFEGSTPREKIQNLYARLGERSNTETLQTEPSATPSSVGDIEASEAPPIPETVAPLSVRVDKDISHLDIPKESVPETSLEDVEPQHEPETFQTIHPSALTISHAEESVPGSLHLGPSEFAVPLPMDSRVKDDYERILFSNTPDVYELIDAGKSPETPESEQERAVSSMRQLLERLSNAATHPDINVAQHVQGADLNLEQAASWADYSSAKFLLLGCLIKAASDHDMHLVISVRGQKNQRIVERYLQGKGFSYTRSREEMGSGTSAEVSMIKAALSFGIQTAQTDGIVETYKAPSALIALDSSLNTKSPSVEHMRTTFARNGHLLPVLRLIVASSSEHVELSFPGPPTPEHLSLLLQYSVGLSDIVGDLQDDALGVHEDANEIMTCLLSDNFNAHWSLPIVEPLREVASIEPTQAEEFSQPNVADDKSSNTQAQKRGFMEEDIEPTSKKARMDESQDTSQLTISSTGPSQPLGDRLQSFEKQLIEMKSDNDATLEKLRKTLLETQSRLQETGKAMEVLQHRYETRTKDLHIIRKERDRLLEAKTTSEKRLEKSKDEILKLKDERITLRHDLEQAREALKTGGGDAAELEKAREEVRRLTKENESLQRKADLANKQTEYTREQYQTASNVAAQSGNELRSLKEENEALKRKADGEAARLRELNTKSDESRHLSRVKELELLLSSREDLLHKKEDELREIRKNRPSTRSTSTQPRSPKITAGNLSRPTSPGLNNNGNNFPGRGSALRFSSEMSF
ncbi:uncharacterized protein BDV17DRAFT_276324 [Aspergillus undulatus]|uniref:uncharacterized protein n=1 Tax=Aspergillus undulatus TaxID=1810928 RepID=UPI003CCD8719